MSRKEKERNLHHGKQQQENHPLRHPADRRLHAWQLSRRSPQLEEDAGGLQLLLLHRRPAFPDNPHRPAEAPPADARGLRPAARLRHRHREEPCLCTEPQQVPRRDGLDHGLLLAVRRALAHDAVQGQVGQASGQHQCRPLHLPGPDGRRHPALSGGLRAGRR